MWGNIPKGEEKRERWKTGKKRFLKIRPVVVEREARGSTREGVTKGYYKKPRKR